MKNLDTVFPFYDSIEEQFRYRDDVDISSVPIIMASDTQLVPFIIRRPHNAGTDSDITLWFYPTDGGSPIEIRGEDASIVITTGSSYDYISYNGRDLPAALPEERGGYYLVVEDEVSGKLWYSETFNVRSSMASYLKLTMQSNSQLSNIMAKFLQILYVDQVLWKAPEYLREDIGEKRNGVLVKEKQVKIKADILRVLQAPEYLVDALILLPFFDNVTMTVQNGDTYTYDEIRTKDPEWIQESYGLKAKVEIQLLRDVVIKKLNFKEMGYSTLPTGGEIKQGGPVLTTPAGDYFTYNVLFDESFDDADYTPAAYVISSGDEREAQLPTITNITAAGFLITTVVACEVRWTAIKK